MGQVVRAGRQLLELKMATRKGLWDEKVEPRVLMHEFGIVVETHTVQGSPEMSELV